MTWVGVSMRVDVIAQRDERRDALDQRLYRWLASGGLKVVPLPNEAPLALEIMAAMPCAALVLSGGNDLAEFGGQTQERDCAELAVLEFARCSGRPVLGICRGAQFLAHHFGGRVERMPGHAGTVHELVHVRWPVRSVHSYHDFAIVRAPNAFSVGHRAPDNTIESMSHAQLPIQALMWHPERHARHEEDDCILQWLAQAAARWLDTGGGTCPATGSVR